ncbi:MAG: alcohol dehydrogenase family protein [Proteobacteria bacterium]|nr:alcohol dehydrogenase family protein [Pseudomonadota bacterium]
MRAVVTQGKGGYEQLAYREVPVPQPGGGEVLVQVLAAGVNNTDINTRVGWYSEAGGWNAPTPFPLIQGTDCCGRIVAVGADGDEQMLGQRVLVRPCMNEGWLGVDFDGAFAQFLKAPAAHVFPVRCDWSDAELGSIPCAYGTAENLLQRAGLQRGEQVLVTGASGGVGSAAVQLARRRGATVTAIAAPEKAAPLRALGADRVLARDADLVMNLGAECIDLIVDNVAGPAFPALLQLLKRGGRYVSAGAIGGPLVSLDMRAFYLKDLTLIGCTNWDEPVFPDLVGYIERGEIRPLVASTFALDQIAAAQRAFLDKRHVGKIVLIPPPP